MGRLSASFCDRFSRPGKRPPFPSFCSLYFSPSSFSRIVKLDPGPLCYGQRKETPDLILLPKIRRNDSWLLDFWPLYTTKHSAVVKSPALNYYEPLDVDVTGPSEQATKDRKRENITTERGTDIFKGPQN